MGEPFPSALPKNDLTARVAIKKKPIAHGAGFDSNQTFGFEPSRTSVGFRRQFTLGQVCALAGWHYDCDVAAAAAALALFRSSCGLGRFLPYVPRKILPRLDRLSPLPIG
jgi:hypothetical protein